MDQPTYTVSELTELVALTLQQRFADELWVQGEIRDLTRSHNGHVYFSLVDPGTDGKESLLPVTLFASERFVVNRVLMRSGGAVRMTDGIQVRIRGRLGLYAQRSTVQLRMSFIDTDFTLGQLAAERQALINELKKDGTLTKNSARPMPLVPLRVGLVTSHGSAAHADFIHELERPGFGFHVVVSHATVQGVEAPESIRRALQQLSPRSIDVIAIVRGGGARTDLAAFDTEVVARAIAECSAPVLTGIGHETDQTVADLAAFDALKTPTACAQRIVASVRGFVDRLDALSTAVARARRTVIVRTEGRVDQLAVRLRAAAGVHLARQAMHIDSASASLHGSANRTIGRREARLRQTAVGAVRLAGLRTEDAGAQVERHSERVATAVRRAIGDADQRLDIVEAATKGSDPAAMFARGWSITYGPSGRPVRHPREVTPSERLRTVVEGGTLYSVVASEEDP